MFSTRGPRGEHSMFSTRGPRGEHSMFSTPDEVLGVSTACSVLEMRSAG